MRAVIALLLACSIGSVGSGCGPSSRGGGDDGPGKDAAIDAPPIPPDACSGLQCQITQCAAMGLPATRVSGTVFAPNGTLPLFGATVYVPFEDPGPLMDGVQCSQCDDSLPGGVIARAQSTEGGQFVVENVPTGTNIPLVVTIGKWRRKLVVPNVMPCVDNPVDPTLTRLPRNKQEGDIPRIAMVTGGCDAQECLLRKLGIADSEFTTDAGMGRVHMYVANGAARFPDNTPFTAASTLWGDLNKLKQYDLMMMGCECSTNAAAKTQAMMNNFKAYADAGGRAFMSHYHNIWIVGDTTHAPAVWPTIATCGADGSTANFATIDTVNNPKGLSFALWMQYVMGSPAPGVIPITEARRTCTAVDNMKAERWVYMSVGGSDAPQNFQFTTPNEMPSNSRCGKIVFSDMHVASGSTSTSPFPNGCASTPMSPQEKALAFMFFDISSCVGIIQ